MAESQKKKISKALVDKYGGKSFEPYCPKFSLSLKERVRRFFGYTCVECGTNQTFPKLHVHHVNFNKMACCDGTKPIFVALCQRCHAKTNYRREYWEQHFTEIVNSKYGGECYEKIEVTLL